MDKVKGKLHDLAESSRVRWTVGIIAGLFVVVNVGIGLIYHNKTLPGTTINQQQFSGVSYDHLPTTLQSSQLLPKNTRLVYKGSSATYQTINLGVAVNTQKVIELSKQQHSLVPLFDMFGSHKIAAPVSVNQKTFNKIFESVEKTFKKEPTNAQIIQTNGNFALQPELNGYHLEAKQVKTVLQKRTSESQNTVYLPVQTLTPKITQVSLKPKFESLQKQQNTSITLHFQSKSKNLTKQEIGLLYGPAGSSVDLSEQKMGALVASIGSGFGIRVENSSEAVGSIRDALEKNRTLNFTLRQLISKRTYSYCVRLKGVDASNQGTLESKLASTFADSRGWSLAGQVQFVRADSGCSFTVWLSAANQMPSFGSICDTTYSCTVRPNVIINYDRWMDASPAWNASGGNLEDYRSMVINHETGHWLGFGHRSCPGAGQPAPVMQQQSISLGGCAFNPWPTASELMALKAILGL